MQIYDPFITSATSWETDTMLNRQLCVRIHHCYEVTEQASLAERKLVRVVAEQGHPAHMCFALSSVATAQVERLFFQLHTSHSQPLAKHYANLHGRQKACRIVVAQVPLVT